MRCPACDAHNPGQARWCGQCFVALTDDPRPDDPRPAAPVRRAGPTDDRDVRARGDEIEWRCGRCGAWAPLAVGTCPTCGTPRSGFAPGEPGAQRQVPKAVAVAASVVLPGSGHVLLGALGTGIARAVLAALWLSGGLALVAGTGGGLVGGALLGGAVVLWAASAFDAARTADGSGDELLGGRRLGVLVLVVTVAAIAGAGATAVGAA